MPTIIALKKHIHKTNVQHGTNKSTTTLVPFPHMARMRTPKSGATLKQRRFNSNSASRLRFPPLQHVGQVTASIRRNDARARSYMLGKRRLPAFLETVPEDRATCLAEAASFLRNKPPEPSCRNFRLFTTTFTVTPTHTEGNRCTSWNRMLVGGGCAVKAVGFIDVIFTYLECYYVIASPRICPAH